MELKEIYASRARDYERLVAREDYQGNILKALQDIRALAGLDVVELGAGTGRLTCMLAPLVRSIRAFDASDHMLGVAREKLAASSLQNWKLEVATNAALPVPDATADLVIAGWSLVYSAIWATVTGAQSWGKRWMECGARCAPVAPSSFWKRWVPARKPRSLRPIYWITLAS